MLMILLVPLIGLCGSIGLHFSAFWLGPEIRRVVVSVFWLRWQCKSWISQVHRLHRLHRPIFSQKTLVGNGGYTDHPTWTIHMMLRMSAIRNHEHGSQLCTRIEVSSHQHTYHLEAAAASTSGFPNFGAVTYPSRSRRLAVSEIIQRWNTFFREQC